MNLPPGCREVRLGLVGSTNDEAISLARRGAEHGTVVWAQAQTTGRGQRRSSWVSPLGNLYCSFILRSITSTDQIRQLTALAGVAVAEALRPFLPAEAALECKWPNDLLVEGRKISGMLIETSDEPDDPWAVLGIGVNVATFPENVARPATSLRAAGGYQAGAGEVLESCCRSLFLWLMRWRTEGFGPIRERWNAMAKGLGESVVVRGFEGRFRGRLRGIDEAAALLLDVPGEGTVRILHGGCIAFLATALDARTYPVTQQEV